MLTKAQIQKLLNWNVLISEERKIAILNWWDRFSKFQKESIEQMIVMSDEWQNALLSKAMKKDGNFKVNLKWMLNSKVNKKLKKDEWDDRHMEEQQLDDMLTELNEI